MEVFTSSLYKKLLSLFPQLGKIPAKDSNLNPCHRLLRKYSCSKAGVVTAADLVNYWQGVFDVNDIPEARASSEYIVSHVLGAKTFQRLNANSISTPLSAKQQEQIQQLCVKRLQRMPVQYVLGEWDFQDLTLKMKPPVFIPRPETEELVSLIVDEESRKQLTSANCKHPELTPENSGLVILEVGCGSGAIALSLLKKLPHSRVIATDKSQAAVNLAKENAARLHLQDRVKILHHDVSSSSWECLLPWGLVDTIISNPPYIFHEDMTQLAAEILRYEDLGALDGGKDGMSIIKQILKLASYVLKDGRSVFLEVDPRHPEMVENWLCRHPDLHLYMSATHNDFSGKIFTSKWFSSGSLGFFGDNTLPLTVSAFLEKCLEITWTLPESQEVAQRFQLQREDRSRKMQVIASHNTENVYILFRYSGTLVLEYNPFQKTAFKSFKNQGTRAGCKFS